MKAESDVCLVVPQKEVCYAAYSGDLAPILMVLGAAVSLASGRGRRRVALTDFYRGDGIEKNVLEPGEIVTAIELPEPANGLRAGYRKLRIRDTIDYPEMGVAAALRLDYRYTRPFLDEPQMRPRRPVAHAKLPRRSGQRFRLPDRLQQPNLARAKGVVTVDDHPQTQPTFPGSGRRIPIARRRVLSWARLKSRHGLSPQRSNGPTPSTAATPAP